MLRFYRKACKKVKSADKIFADVVLGFLKKSKEVIKKFVLEYKNLLSDVVLKYFEEIKSKR